MSLSHPPTRDFTATTFVVRDGRTLLLWHNKIQTWLPPGGHIDEGELPEDAAVREVLEESGLAVELVTTGPPAGPLGAVRRLHQPVCILLEDIEPGHQHVDLIYFARPVDDRPPRANPREAADLRWFGPADLADADVHADIHVLGHQAIAAVGSARP